MFDSYGIKPNKDFMKYMKKFKNWTYNKTRLQGAFSTTCGQYCLCYLFFKCMGLSLKEFGNPFNKNDFHFNDHLINDICSHYFKIKHNIFTNSNLNQICIALGH